MVALCAIRKSRCLLDDHPNIRYRKCLREYSPGECAYGTDYALVVDYQAVMPC